MADVLKTSSHNTVGLAHQKRTKLVTNLVCKLLSKGYTDIKISQSGLLNSAITITCNEDIVASYNINTLYNKPILQAYTFECLDEYLLD